MSENSTSVDPNTDRYPYFEDVISVMTQHEDFPDGDLDRIEINCLPNGQGTWRVWPAKAEDPIGGVYLGA